jgi:hypothetical protein
MKKLFILIMVLPIAMTLASCADDESGVLPGQDGSLGTLGGPGTGLDGTAKNGVVLGMACEQSYDQTCVEYFYSVKADALACPYGTTEVPRCPRDNDYVGACIGPVVENGPAKVSIDIYYYQGSGYSAQEIKTSCEWSNGTFSAN